MKALSIIGIVLAAIGIWANFGMFDPAPMTKEAANFYGVFFLLLFGFFLALSIVALVKSKKKKDQ